MEFKPINKDGVPLYNMGIDFGDGESQFVLMRHMGNGMWKVCQPPSKEVPVDLPCIPINATVVNPMKSDKLIGEVSHKSKPLTAEERGEPIMCAMCDSNTVNKEGEFCAVCSYMGL